jgi:protein-tyrosine phosphatase
MGPARRTDGRGLRRDTFAMLDVSAPSARGHWRLPFRVLMVCTGNLHRSPLAERLLTARLGSSREMFQVSSAGTAARAGTPMDPVAAALLAGLGGDPCGATARRLTAELVENADLVLGAATEHRDAAVRLSPAWALRRTFTLREFARLLRAEDADGVAEPADRAAELVRGAGARRGAEGRGEDDDLADPYGAPERVARSCAGRIAESVQRIAVALLG